MGVKLPMIKVLRIRTKPPGVLLTVLPLMVKMPLPADEPALNHIRPW